MESFRQFFVQGTKRSLLTLSALCLLSAPAAAQSVVVDGVGADERAALIDASRAAVEQVAGTFIDSRTLVENAAVKLDQIYTKAQGFVTGTEILYLVLGRVQSQAVDISLPDGEGGSYRKTQLKSGHARLTVDVIRTATGEVVGTFTTSAKGVGTSEAMAQAKAVEKASSKAAERLEEKFRHLGSEAGGHEW